jgi:kumamolisin
LPDPDTPKKGHGSLSRSPILTQRIASLTTLCAALCLTGLLTQPAMAAAPVATDLGSAPDADTKDIMITLAVPDRAALEAFVASTVDPRSPNFHKFLKPGEFAARFGQSQAVIDRVTTNLATQGISVTRVYGNKLVLAARGTNAHLAAAFSAPIHTFSADSGSFQKPVGRVAIPAVLQDVVTHVSGLSTQPVYRPHGRRVPAEATALQISAADPSAAPVAGTPGTYSVNDLAKRNNITPLYAQGITGAGTTLGIMTFATFKPADVGAYWTWAGQSGSTSRITTINVGTGQTASGADETTLDVEQSGGVAPGANIRVYVAPNTDAGALALYTQAITENLCDTLSISWGESEVFYDPETDLPQYDTLFLQAAAQGTPITASSGDEASYDLNNPGSFPYPNYNTVLTVDYPSSSPYVVAAGGTTLPVTLKLAKGTIVNPTERPWAWDYLRSYIVANAGLAAYYANDFPVGGGGGVSIDYPVPSYQQGLAGVMSSAAGQSMFCFSSPTKRGTRPCVPGTELLRLPAGYAGRNTPDVSMNADPETGYAVYYNGKWILGYGGTSFVAPQLNGIFALLTQKLGTRVGWPHPQLYSLFRTMGHGPGSPFRAITSGDNLFYVASPDYNPAVGLGALDVGNLAAVYQAPAH